MTDSTSDALTRCFDPRTIAIVGATANPSKLGHVLVENLARTDDGRRVYAVGRSDTSIFGLPTFSSLRELPEPPDLVLVSVPAAAAPEVASDAAAIGAASIVVLACGFAEAGDEGRRLQEDLVARAGGVRVLGPNCMGIANLHANLNATYFKQLPADPGTVAVISQSGAFSGIALEQLRRLGVGVSRIASIGNMSDVTHAELVRHVARQPDTRVVVLFIEAIPDAADLLDAIAGVGLPVIVLKAGRTPAGRAAALSHTGSMTGDGSIWDELLREAGAVVAHETEELFDVAATYALGLPRLPHRARVAIVTISGGPSVVAADACARFGCELPSLEKGLQSIRDLVPPFASLRNPVDLTAQTAPSAYGRAMETVLEHADVDAAVAVNVGLDLREFGDAFANAALRSGKPVVAYVLAPGIEAVLRAASIPNFPSVERALRALSSLRLPDEGAAPERIAPRLETLVAPQGILDEHEAKDLLRRHGLPVVPERLATSAAEAVDAAREIGLPVVVKVCSRAITHKTEVGGVWLDLRTEADVEGAVLALNARFPGEAALVQRLADPGVELLLGARRDHDAGPIVVVGFGGALVEFVNDMAVCRVPLDRRAALRALARLRSQQLLAGFRGMPVVDRESLADLMVDLGALVEEMPSIVEVDLNPVIATSAGLLVVDALVRVED